jgi:hypothetical protein
MNAPLAARHPLTIHRSLTPAAPRAQGARPAHVFTHRVEVGRALQLGRQRGELTVVRGLAWVTCHDDLRDHVVEAGEGTLLPEGHLAVIEPLRREDVLLCWRPHEPRGTGR